MENNPVMFENHQAVIVVHHDFHGFSHGFLWISIDFPGISVDFPLFISWLDICCGELTTMIGDDRRRSELGYFYTWRSQGLLTFISPSFCDVANTCVYYIYN